MSEIQSGQADSPVSIPKGYLSPLRLMRRTEGGLILAILVVLVITALLDTQHAY
jgi:hypothetical protein